MLRKINSNFSWKIYLDDIFIINKGRIATMLFCLGILLAVLGSLQPIYMWKFANTYSILASLPIVLSISISRTISNSIYTRTDFIMPLTAYIILQVFMKLVAGANINSYIDLFFNVIIAYALFSVDQPLLQKCSKFICIVFGGFLAVSLLFFILYIIGFPLPSKSISHPFLEYTYIEYPFLLVDDRQFMVLIPRFNSVCLEPGHLGTIGSLFLLAQIGNWKKWYNIVILIATIFSFSLAAYGLMLINLFVIAWTKGKKILPSIIGIGIVCAAIVVGAIFYNDGDNMVNALILDRLEVEDDGNISGNNRVTDEFQAEFDKYIQTSDVIFGRGESLKKFGFGNSGYKVFLYDYGLITTLMVLFFYVVIIIPSKNHRAKIGMLVVFIAGFWIRAIPLYYYFLVPLYFFAYTDRSKYEVKTRVNNEHDNKDEEAVKQQSGETEHSHASL